ncbi:MAG: hypothetical protein IPM13_00030 [Phycisphaerales bacterium]|nr:hypothetical protein [Phycisphaerales bacterium]
MSIQFVLTRRVPLRRFDLVATIAREEARAELAPVLVWAKQEVDAVGGSIPCRSPSIYSGLVPE